MMTMHKKAGPCKGLRRKTGMSDTAKKYIAGIKGKCIGIMVDGNARGNTKYNLHKLAQMCGRKLRPVANPTTKPKSISFKAKPCAKGMTNGVSRKRKVRKQKLSKHRQQAPNSYIKFLREYKTRNGMIPEQELVKRAALAWCLMSEKMKRKYRAQARQKKT
ncbi:uncharacterized protein LOC115482965 [Drosophila hydei]|uniref:Uncharacterized protein LOC111598451 n=1 Tax=Drosophila hydei TaxID=7224 RepID=A0A6J2STW4_DROHY|nr:uncharacterized protein LOC111598451 [Drosophila hydei]XP_030079344.1 uncharacterized protein LOC115482965 [Drosophila hydei]